MRAKKASFMVLVSLLLSCGAKSPPAELLQLTPPLGGERHVAGSYLVSLLCEEDWQALLTAVEGVRLRDFGCLESYGIRGVGVTFAGGEGDEFLAALYATGQILGAEPNRLSVPQALADSFRGLSLSYSDLVDTPWLQAIGLTRAFEHYGEQSRPLGSGPIVAILDSGLDITHPDLQGRVAEVPALGGCSRFGCNATAAGGEELGNPEIHPAGAEGMGVECPYEKARTCNHGTQVAGIIAARQGDHHAGVCPDCQVLMVKVVEERGEYAGTIRDDALAAGLRYLIELKQRGVPIRILNTSFGKFRRSVLIGLYLERLAALDILIVAAAGNEGTQKPQFPAGHHQVLSVANVSSTSLERHRSSNFGEWVDLAAPGSGPCIGRASGIASTMPGGGVVCGTGTSFSAPIVAGVSGVILSGEPELTASELRTRLLLGAQTTVYDPVVNQPFRGLLGRGLVSADGSARLALTSLGAEPASAPLVKEGCGVVGGQGGALGFLVLGFLGLLRRRGD